MRLNNTKLNAHYGCSPAILSSDQRQKILRFTNHKKLYPKLNNWSMHCQVLSRNMLL